MIALTCTNCRAELSIDEGFAGGVCRCQYCGAIQTVPAPLKGSGGVSALPKPKPARTLYQKQSRPGGSAGTGLDDLASAVASSGLASERLRSANVPGAIERRVRFQPKAVAAAALGILALSAIILLILDRREEPTRRDHVAASPTAPTAAKSPPAFCGVPLEERRVVYVLDRGSATSDVFGHLKEACFKSIETLGPQRKFQIVFWGNGTEVVAFPRTQPTYATRTNIDAARHALDEVNAHGQSDAAPALAKAFASDPEAIVLATGKGYELDDAFVTLVEKARGTGTARVHTFAVGAGEPGTALKAIADRTGGRFSVVTASALRDATE